MTSTGSQRRPSRARSPRRPAATRVPADNNPVARVAVDVPLAHLDRPFDYQVSRAHAAAAQPGVRVRVRFAGRLVDGFVLERAATSDHPGRLAFLERVISPEPVLTPAVAALCRAVADRYAGTLADVLRLAVPPRHARAETGLSSPGSRDAVVSQESAVSRDAVVPQEPAGSPDAAVSGGTAPAQNDLGTPAGGDVPSVARPAGPGAGDRGPEEKNEEKNIVIPNGWQRYGAGAAFLAAVGAQRSVRAVWQAVAGENWPMRVAELAATALRAGRGALLIVPDARQLARLDTALTAVLPDGAYTLLSADLGPAERYRRFLAIRRGDVRVVAGTRAAAFAPVRGLGLLTIFDDGDDLHSERRAPYPHAREVLILRSVAERAALLVGGFARTAEGQLLVESGWAASIQADRAAARRAMPRVEAVGDGAAGDVESAASRARLPPAAFAAARRALESGAPVLVQVPRRGYLPGFACGECRRPARCRRCSGSLAWARSARTASCRWCGIAAPHWVCPACGSTRIRATVVGAARTAEEIGRAFPGVRLRTSTGGTVLATVPAEAAMVVATPGAEPVADGGYGAALLLDGGILLGRADLRAAEEALRRWMGAATLVRSAGDGGRVVVGADAGLPTVRSLVRWQPVEHAAAELAARRDLHFPPTAAMASLEGAEATVTAAIGELSLPETADVLGPVPIAPRAHSDGPAAAGGEPADRVRALVRVPPTQRKILASALRVLAVGRSARKDPEPLRIEVDPIEVG